MSKPVEAPAKTVTVPAVHRRVLLISANPYPLSIGTLQQIARDKVAEGARVDAFDAFSSVVAHAPQTKPLDRLYERIGSKYRRFILPAINGVDLTARIVVDDDVTPPLPETIDELRAARAHGAKVGLGALSSAASLTRIAARDRTAHYGIALVKAWDVAHRAAAAASQLPTDYDEVYIFNGRHAESRPFCDVMEQYARVIRYEAGGLPNSYILSPGALHDARNIAARVRADRIDEAAGHDFFAARRGREPGTDAHRFTAGQTIGLLPETLRTRRVVSFFTSSEDETFATQDDATFGAFATQYDVAIALAELCAARGYTLALRLHPHLALKSDDWKRDWDFAALDARAVQIIMPNEKIDSYALVDASDAVVTCGSTIGIEAAFAGKPSLMVGDYPATVLGICPAAQDATDIARFLDDPTPLADATAQAIGFGSYVLRSGKVVPGLADAIYPERARLDGRTIDPARRLVHGAKRLMGRERT